MANTVTGLFKDKESAESAYLGATNAGYSADEIDVVMSEETRERFYGKDATLVTEVGNKSAQGAAVGGAIPEDRLKEYEEGVDQGGILVGVRSRNDEDSRRLAQEWESNRGYHIHS